jgi:CelD/BcsL family acetyltransferase involved in cellulose biosynthesis
MQTTILRDRQAIQALRESWSAQGAPSPFHGWLSVETWLEQCKREIEPFVILVSEQGRWVAAALWCVARDRWGIRRLTGIGGEDAWYHDPWILEPAKDAAIAKALVDALKSRHQDWDMLQLVLRDAQSGALIRALGCAGLAVTERIAWQQHQTASLGEDWTAYWEARPKGLRDMIRRRQKQIAALQPRFIEADAGNLDRLLTALFRLHEDRWRDERDWSGYYRHLRAIATEALERGDLCFYALEAEETPLALELLVSCGERAYELVRVIDPSPTYTPYSAGSLLTAWALEHMHQRGIREVDFGPGHHEWKAKLETYRTETVQLVVAQPTRLPALAVVGWGGIVKPYLREVPLVKHLKTALSNARKHETQAAPAT